jgi:hypothetical protein
MFQTTVSVGDLIVAAVSLCSALGVFYAVKYQVIACDYKVEELRRGRGLILEHWPHTVQRCFGFVRGRPSDSD